MHQAQRSPLLASTVSDQVRVALAMLDSRQPLSTKAAIALIRSLGGPAAGMSNEDLTELILMYAVEQHRTILFDGRDRN